MSEENKYKHTQKVIDSEGNEIPLDQLPPVPEGTFLTDEELKEKYGHLDPSPLDLLNQYRDEDQKSKEE
tara:strand:- start:1309 stop:1515 length:207 start_codon:yes stop_codon:yes gene_type:complete